jgi:hypothetical protein
MTDFVVHVKGHRKPCLRATAGWYEVQECASLWYLFATDDDVLVIYAASWFIC